MAAADVIADALGQRFVDSVPLNMERAWAESSPRVPVICLLSPGQRITCVLATSLWQCLGELQSRQVVRKRKIRSSQKKSEGWVLKRPFSITCHATLLLSAERINFEEQWTRKMQELAQDF